MLARPRSVRLVRRLLLAASVVLSCALAGPAAAEEAPLTRARVAELLRVAPSSRAADARTRAAAAALNAAGATTALEEPVLSALGGVRFQPDAQRSFSAVASLSVPLDLGGQSAAQGDAARAELRAASATRDAEGQRGLARRPASARACASGRTSAHPRSGAARPRGSPGGCGREAQTGRQRGRPRRHTGLLAGSARRLVRGRRRGASGTRSAWSSGPNWASPPPSKWP
jgi:hypothetical protein